MLNKINLNDLLTTLEPKILRFTGDKFPSELWSYKYSSIKNKKLNS